MSHLRLVPPLPAATSETSEAPAIPAPRVPWSDPKEARAFFQAASGICLCRDCSKLRHPAYGAR